MASKLIGLCLFWLVAQAAAATATITTNVAPGGTIIDSSGAVNAAHDVTHVIDGNTHEGAGSPVSYWLAPDAASQAYFILDLRRDYLIKSLAVYNTHDQAANDYGSGNFVVTAAAAVEPTPGTPIAGYYPFDGDADDHSTNGVNGTLVADLATGSILPTFDNDVPAAVTGDSKSIHFSGAGDRVDIPDPPGFVQPTAYTFSLWVKFLTNDVEPALAPTSLIVRTASSGSESNTWSSQLRLTATRQFEHYLWDNTAERTIRGTTTVQPNVWYHVAGTAQTGGQMHLYVNGREEGTALTIVGIWAGGSLYELGSGSGGGFGTAAERMDEVAIWNSVLTPDKIKNLSQGQSPLNQSGSLGLRLVKPQTLVSNMLADVSDQADITPSVFNLSTPVTARYVMFQALDSIYAATYPSGHEGLNEIQVVADVEPPQQTIQRGLQITWPANPFGMVLQSSTDSVNWSTVPIQPVQVGTNWVVFQLATNGVNYRLNAP